MKKKPLYNETCAFSVFFGKLHLLSGTEAFIFVRLKQGKTMVIYIVVIFFKLWPIMIVDILIFISKGCS